MAVLPYPQVACLAIQLVLYEIPSSLKPCPLPLKSLLVHTLLKAIALAKTSTDSAQALYTLVCDCFVGRFRCKKLTKILCLFCVALLSRVQGIGKSLLLGCKHILVSLDPQLRGNCMDFCSDFTSILHVYTCRIER